LEEEYVTGIDRSYPRSIYKVLKTSPDGKALLQFISLAGFIGDVPHLKKIIRPLRDFRLATSDEIANSKAHIWEGEKMKKIKLVFDKSVIGFQLYKTEVC